MNVTATSSGDADVITSASASGGKKSSESGGEDADAKAADARASADSRADSSDARTSSTTQDNPSSSNSDGSIAVAAAFAINLPEWETRATIPIGRSVTVDGQLNIRSFANHDASAIADASAVEAEDLGVGIAVALMSADVINAATIGTSTVVADGLTVEANMRNLAGDQQHTFEAKASSGAGKSDNSIAGSFSLGINTIKTHATIANLANVDVNQHDLTVKANSDTSHKVHALPKGAASGSDFGLGLSFAFGAVDEMTVASIGAGATLTEVDDLAVTAKSKSIKDNLAQAGAEGDTAFGGALSILISNEDTLARVETRTGNTVVGGNVEISADHTGTATSKGDASALGGADAGIGITGSFAYVNEVTEAQLQRDMTITGNLSILSTSSGSSTTESKASASGAKEKENETTDSKAQSQRDSADTSAAASGARTSGDQANPSASTNSGGSIAVAAAVTINVAETDSRAEISSSKTVKADGVTIIRARADHDRFATADGSAVLDGGDLAVGVAVALIGGSIDNEALIGDNTTLTTDGLTLEAVMKDPTARHQFEARATSGAGGGDYGIAGSVTVAILDADATAEIGNGAKIQGLAAQPVVIQAVANTTNLGEAKPNDQPVSGSSSFGLGGSFSLVRTTHDVAATVSSNATISSGASSLTVAASADHDTTSIAINGAKGESDDDSGGGGSGATAIGAAVSLVLSHNQTHALVDTANSGTTVTGDATVRARHKHKIAGQADGTVSGAETGVGISFGMNQVDDHASATLNRSLTANNVTIESIARIDSDVETMASTSGTSGDSNNPDEEADAQRNPSSAGAASNTGETKTLPKSSEESEDATDSNSSQGGTGSGDLGVAASVAFNIIEMNNKAKVGAGAVITATQAVRVSANGHLDALAKGLGESVTTDEADTVAAGVGFNYVDTDNTAEVGINAQISGNNITVEAITADADSAMPVNEFVSWGRAASGGDGDYSVAASVGFNILKLDYQATTAPGSSLKSTGDLTVQTEADIQPQTMAVAGSGTTGKAFGGSLAYAEVDIVSNARIDGNADATNALKVDADSIVRTTPTVVPEVNENVDVNTVAIAGSASGDSLALAASLAVDDYSINTTASIGPNSQINQTPGFSASASQSVTVEATSDTDVTSLVGSGALSLEGTGLGAGVQIGIVSNTTKALIETNADVKANSHVTVKAISDEKTDCSFHKRRHWQIERCGWFGGHL